MESKKRPLSVPKRVPLAETNQNVPLPALKKAKVRPGVAVPTKNDADTRPEPKADQHDKNEPKNEAKPEGKAETKSARLVGDELKGWQASWRKIMRESVVYFDTLGNDSTNTHHQEQKRAQRALKLVGCEILPFYDRDVSIIVSRRPFSASKMYPGNDIFHDAASLKIKVWDYDKVFRFLKNLGVDAAAAHERSGNLSHLLKEEKIFGSTDRDPNARRDDLYYLEKNFVYVYDLSQAVRPIAVREWPSELYPAFHLTLDGKCPFIADTSDNLDRKRLRRMQKFDATRDYRELLKKASHDNVARSVSLAGTVFSATSTSTDNTTDGSADLLERTLLEAASDDDFKAPAALERNSSVMPTASTSKFYDVAASGYNGASNAMQFSMDSTLNSVALAQQGNGLGPAVSQVPSKNVNNLKRRIFMKKQLHKAADRERELKPGYCENCRVKYDHFDDHIFSNRHRNFACNDANFKDIDELIANLNESKCMGYVTSNGDYSFST